MAEYFAGGHLRFVNGEWRDDNGDAIEISRVRHGRWIEYENEADKGLHYCSECKHQAFNYDEEDSTVEVMSEYCPNCGAKMDGGDGNSAMA